MTSLATGAFAATLLLAVCAVGMPRTAVAADESCKKCKHVDCLKGSIRRKNAMAAGYTALERKYGVAWKKDGQPRMEVNMADYRSDAARAETYLELKRQHALLATDENTLSEAAGPAEGCAYSDGLEIGTNIETCAISGPMGQALQESPCKLLGDLIARHEGQHQKECEVRAAKGKVRLIDPVSGTVVRDMPTMHLTPAGKARSEANAYRMEVAALEAELKKAEGKCETSFRGVKTSCTMPPAAVGQEITGKVCGNPVTATWTINTTNWVRAPYIGEQRTVDPPWESDCVAKGSAEERRREAIYRAGPGKGWMCVYEDKPTPQIHIRYFRLPQCRPSTEQTYTVPAIRGECDEDMPPVPQPPPTPDRPVS